MYRTNHPVHLHITAWLRLSSKEGDEEPNYHVLKVHSLRINNTFNLDLLISLESKPLASTFFFQVSKPNKHKIQPARHAKMTNLTKINVFYSTHAVLVLFIKRILDKFSNYLAKYTFRRTSFCHPHCSFNEHATKPRRVQ